MNHLQRCALFSTCILLMPGASWGVKFNIPKISKVLDVVKQLPKSKYAKIAGAGVIGGTAAYYTGSFWYWQTIFGIDYDWRKDENSYRGYDKKSNKVYKFNSKEQKVWQTTGALLFGGLTWKFGTHKKLTAFLSKTVKNMRKNKDFTFFTQPDPNPCDKSLYKWVGCETTGFPVKAAKKVVYLNLIKVSCMYRGYQRAIDLLHSEKKFDLALEECTGSSSSKGESDIEKVKIFVTKNLDSQEDREKFTDLIEKVSSKNSSEKNLLDNEEKEILIKAMKEEVERLHGERKSLRQWKSWLVNRID